MFVRVIFPRRALERGVGGWGTKGEPLGTLLSPISCRVARNGHPKHNLIFFRVAKNEHKKIINQNQSIRCSPHQSADKRLPASPLEKPNGRGDSPHPFSIHSTRVATSIAVPFINILKDVSVFSSIVAFSICITRRVAKL